MKNTISILGIKLLLIIAILFSTISQAQVVVIDPGHGYASDGSNPDGRTDTEHATALSVGIKLKNLIEDDCNGWSVHLTRNTRNGWLTLSQRRAISNNWRADRFISIHCNAGEEQVPKHSGVIVVILLNHQIVDFLDRFKIEW